MKLDNFKKILILNNEFEASIMKEVLTERNIPHHIQSYHSIAYDGIFQFSQGWGHLEADPVYEKEILEIYQKVIEAENWWDSKA